MGRRPTLSALIEYYLVYSSRNRILHKVKNVKRMGRFLYVTMDCGIIVKVKDSKHGRAARWLTKQIYWKPCRRCRIPKGFLAEHPPFERFPQ